MQFTDPKKRIAVQVEHQRNPGDSYFISTPDHNRGIHILRFWPHGSDCRSRVKIRIDHDTPAADIAAQVAKVVKPGAPSHDV